MTDPRIPAALAPAIKGIVSLHDFRPRAEFRKKPAPTFTQGSYSYEILTPADLAKIYNLTPAFNAGVSGQGETIAVIEDTSDVDPTDWATFRAALGLSVYSAGSFTKVNPSGRQHLHQSDGGQR